LLCKIHSTFRHSITSLVKHSRAVFSDLRPFRIAELSGAY